MIVERVVCGRHVRIEGDRLYPWDEAEKRFAAALEVAAMAAPDPERKRETMALAVKSWRTAGDENRAQMLERLVP